MGYDIAMVMLKKGDCEHCGMFYRYSLWHSGFGDNSYAYCDQCGVLATISYTSPEFAALPPISNQYGEIETSWEPHLRPCPCGGSFRKGASPRCPYCHEQLSPTHAAVHIEEQARGAPRGWQWQNNWNGVYCISIEDPYNAGTLLQVEDPVLMPETEKTRSRWSMLFSFGR